MKVLYSVTRRANEMLRIACCKWIDDSWNIEYKGKGKRHFVLVDSAEWRNNVNTSYARVEI